MTTRQRLTLSAPYPPITTAETTDTRTGRVRYRFRGPRATGTVVIAPYRRGWEALPSAVHLRFGDGPDHQTDQHRTDRPCIHGVSLVGGLILTPADYLNADKHRRALMVTFRRSTGRYTTTRAPERTSRYAAAIVHALLTTWHARPDRDDLVRAAARLTAAHHLRCLYESAINPTRERIAELTRTLDDHRATAAELCALAGEYHHLYGQTEPVPDPDQAEAVR